MPNIGPGEWLTVVGSVVAVLVYAFEKFQTKDDAKHIEAFLIERLDRIEDKLDAAIQRR